MSALMRFELRMFATARLTWIVFALLFAAMLWGAGNGARHAREQQAAVARVLAHEAQALAESRAAVARYARPAAALLPYWQDPSDVAGFMRYRLVAYAVKPPSPLAAIAVGQSRLLPYYLRTSLDYVAPPAASFDFVNPRSLSLGDFDLAFVLVYVLPLALIALGAPRLAAERDSGALVLMAVQLPSLRGLVLLKFCAMALVCIPVVLVASALALLLASDTMAKAAASGAAGVFLLLAAALAGFTLFWCALTALVASRIGMIGSALRLIALWIGFGFVVPAGGALAIGLAYPAPDSLQYLERMRTANDVSAAQRNAIFVRQLGAHAAYAPYRPAAARLDQVSYATKMIFIQREVDGLLKPQREAAARQRAAAARAGEAIRWLSPIMLFDALLQRAAGTGAERHQQFLRQSDSYTNTLRRFFWPRALADAAHPVIACQGCAARMNFVEHERIPRYAADDPLAGVAAALAAGTGYLCLTAAAAMLMLRRRREFSLAA